MQVFPGRQKIVGLSGFFPIGSLGRNGSRIKWTVQTPPLRHSWYCFSGCVCIVFVVSNNMVATHGNYTPIVVWLWVRGVLG